MNESLQCDIIINVCDNELSRNKVVSRSMAASD